MTMADVDVPDGGYGWMVVFASFILNFVVIGMPRSYGVVYVVILEKFNTSATTAAWIHSLFNTLKLVFGPVSSLLCNRFSARKVVMCGGLVLSSGVIMSSFSTSVYHVYVTYGVIGGIGGSLLFTPSLIVIGDYFNKKKGKAMSISSMGGGIGTLTLAPLFTFLLSYYGFRGGFLIIGGMCLHCVIAGALLRPLKTASKEVIINNDKKQIEDLKCRNTNAVKSKDNAISLSEKDITNDYVTCKEIETFQQTDLMGKDTSNALETEESKQQRNDDETTKSSCCPSLLQNRPFLLYLGCLATMPFCLQVVFLFIADFAKEQSVDENKRALLISVMGITDIVGRVLSGLLFDLKTIRTRRTLVQACLGVLFGLATMTISAAHSLPLLFLTCSLHGVTEGMFHSQRATILSEFVTKKQLSLAVGWITCIQGAANLIGPVLGGLIRDHLESYEAVFLIGGASFAMASVVFLLNYIWTNSEVNCHGSLSGNKT